MKWHTDYHWMNTNKKKEFVNITHLVRQAVDTAAIQEGLALVSAMHITSGVFVNDEEPGIKNDFMEWAESLAPYRPDYQHHQTGETNGDAHLKSILFHHQILVPVTAGKLDLGPWQQIFYAEFDGQRRKRLLIKVMGE